VLFTGEEHLEGKGGSGGRFGKEKGGETLFPLRTRDVDVKAKRDGSGALRSEPKRKESFGSRGKKRKRFSLLDSRRGLSDYKKGASPNSYCSEEGREGENQRSIEGKKETAECISFHQKKRRGDGEKGKETFTTFQTGASQEGRVRKRDTSAGGMFTVKLQSRRKGFF